MPLIPIDLQPGVFKNGTKYAGRGRWADSNLVRWKDNAIRPVGGWQRRIDTSGADVEALFTDPSVEAPRNILGWTSLLGGRHFVVGTNRGLYHIASSGEVSDITPIDFVMGDKDSDLLAGYGVGIYGAAAYGTPRTGQGLTASPSASWSFDLWGEDLIAQFRSEGPLYKWSPNVDLMALPIDEAPDNFQGIIVTDERILMGIDAVSRLVSWSTSEDRTDWTPAATNQAGSLRLAGNGALVSIIKVVNTVLIVGQNEAYVGRYLGPPFVYGFERVSDSSGIDSANAIVVADRFAMWPGGRNIWRFDGAQVVQVRSDVVDFFKSDADPNQLSKMHGFALRDFNEIWWLYQSKGSLTRENDSYICYDYANDHWTRGRLDRSIGADKGASLATPVMISPDGRVFNHELAGVAITTGIAPFCETAPLEIGVGDTQAYLDYIYPDVEAAGNLQATFIARDMPQSPFREYGPYDMTNPVPIRVRGRQFAMRLSGTGPSWSIGSMRINVKSGGRK